MSPILRFTPQSICRFAAAPILSSLLCGLINAQTPGVTGSVAGRVADAQTGMYRQGAIVTVRGTRTTDYTDGNGAFNLPGVPAGRHTLDVDYIGLDPFSVEFVASGGAVTAVNPALKGTVIELQQFVVAESLRGQALASNQQRAARGIVNIVSEDMFGEIMKDGNIGYAVQRLPGITVDRDFDGSPTGANIRGLSNDFNSFQVDGNRIDGGGEARGFSTNELAADGVSNIEVIKAPTPDRDGDAIGGIINVISRSAFERDGRDVKLTLAGTYNDMPHGKWGYGGKLSFSDIFDVGGKQKNLGISFTLSSYRTNRYYENTDMEWLYLTVANNPTLNLAQDVYYMYSTENDVSHNETTNHGITTSIDFRTDENNIFYVRPGYSRGGRETSRHIFFEVPDDRHEESRTGRKTLAALTPTSSLSGPNDRGSYEYRNLQRTRDSDIFSIAAGGKHEIGATTWNYDLFYSRAKRDDLDTRYTIENSAAPYMLYAVENSNRLNPTVTILNANIPANNPLLTDGINLAEFELIPRLKTVDQYSGRIDMERQFAGDRSSGSFKFGAKYRVSEPKQEAEEALYETGSSAVFPYDTVLSPTKYSPRGRKGSLDINMSQVVELFRNQPRLFDLQEFDTLAGGALGDYSAKETTTSAYGMGTFKFGRTTLVTGLRMEHNTWKARTYAVDEPTLTRKAIDNSNDYTVWLPGFHLRHELRKNLILRESYNRSYGRPDIQGLTLARVEDEDGNIEAGNPFLKETTSENFDIQLEYFTDRGGLYSAGLFYKKMKGFYYTRLQTFNAVDGNGVPIPVPNGDLEFEQANNANGGKNYGLELMLRQNLHFLPAPFKGFGVYLTATFADSVTDYPDRPGETLPTFGFSDFMFNGSLEYRRGKFSGAAHYRYRSEYLEGLEGTPVTDDWFGVRELIDVEAAYRVTDRLKLFLEVENATNELMISWKGNPRNPEDIVETGRRWTVGATFNF